MAHFAVISLPFYSHLRLFEALAEGLALRGHRVSMLVPPGADLHLGHRLVSVLPVATAPRAAESARRAGEPRGLFGILRVVADGAARTEALCREGPLLLRAGRVDAIIGDELEPAAGLLARHLNIPQISVASSVPTEDAPGIPPAFLNWRFDRSEKGLARLRGGERVARHLMRRQHRTIAAWAERFGLGTLSDARDCLSPDLRLAQTVPGFDFPRPGDTPLVPVGPIRAPTLMRDMPADFTPDPERPLAFATLGTLQGHRLSTFRAIAKACRRLELQLFVAHTGRLTRDEAESIDAEWVTDFAPQAALMRRADICITHGGLNTVLDALAATTPVLALPMAFDQPGIGARILHHGFGEVVPMRKASAGQIGARLERLLADLPGTRARIAPVSAEIARAGGLSAALDRIESRLGIAPLHSRSPDNDWREPDVSAAE